MFEARYLPVNDDYLPDGQEAIQTQSLTQFATQARLLMNIKKHTGYSMIATATGRTGAGKSVAVQDFLQKQPAQPHTGLPACIELSVQPDSTPKTFVEDLLLRLEDQRRPRLESTRYKLSNRAAEIILSYDFQLIIVDEAEQLNTGGFEFLRYLFKKTSCPLLLVGLESLIPMLEAQEKLFGHIGFTHPFLPPSEEEVLTTVLPKLVLPRWTYDPTDLKDYAMGKDLWSHAKNSFRNLRVILQAASEMASLDQETPITADFLTNEVYPVLKQATSKRAARSTTETPYEKESRQRQDKRRGKRGEPTE